MRKLTLSVVVAFVALFGVPAVAAAEVEVREARVIESVAPATSAPVAGELTLIKVQVEERASADEAAAQFAQRGSFWWIVGVIVVAGVILALVV
jgi:hypothetical protein